MGNRCIIDQHVHPSKRIVCRCKQLPDLLMVTYIRCNCNRRTGTNSVIFSGCLFNPLRMTGIEDNIVSLFPEQFCRLFTDSAPGTGNQNSTNTLLPADLETIW